MKKVADMEKKLFVSKIDDYFRRKTTVSTGLMVDSGVISYIIRDAKKLQPNIPVRESLHRAS